MIFHIDSAMKYSYSNDDTRFSIDVIDDILEEAFDALLDEGSEILHSIKGTILEKKLFAKFDEFIEMIVDENSESESDTEEPSFEKKSLLTPITKLKHLLKNLLQILNSNLFLITWNMYSWKNPLFLLLSYHLSFMKKTKTNSEMSLHGKRRNCAWTQVVQTRPRSRQSKNGRNPQCVTNEVFGNEVYGSDPEGFGVNPSSNEFRLCNCDEWRSVNHGGRVIIRGYGGGDMVVCHGLKGCLDNRIIRSSSILPPLP
nr:reverse transcriptase domain-containing protein [Tanacetum cinerariifolium]